MAKKKKRGMRDESRPIVDFGSVTTLPERLAELLRALFQVSYPEWRLMLALLAGRMRVKGTDKVAHPYKRWVKSKGKGKGVRHFAAPLRALKIVQDKILYNFLSEIPTHHIRHGIRRKSSIMTNVTAHSGAKAVLGLDIVDAYPHTFRSRMRAHLVGPLRAKLKEFGVDFLRNGSGDEKITDADVALMVESVVDILCLADRLPQGPSTSPQLFAICTYTLDRDLAALVRRLTSPLQWYRITAYSDNYTISSDGEIPDEVKAEIVKVFEKHGWPVHNRADKQEYYSPAVGKTPIVTGLVLGPDGSLTAAPNKMSQFRAVLHRLVYADTPWSKKARGKALGTLGFIRQVYPDKLPSAIRRDAQLLKARIGKYPIL